MGVDFIVGPAVDITELAFKRGKDDDELLYEDCGMPHDPEIDSFKDEDDFGDGYLDSLFYAYAYEHLPRKYGVEKVFSYYDVPSTGHWWVYCDVHEVYDSGKPFDVFVKILREEFGDDVDVGWLEATRW